MPKSWEKCGLCMGLYRCNARRSGERHYLRCVMDADSVEDCPVALLHAENQRLREENERVQREASRMLRECEAKVARVKELAETIRRQDQLGERVVSSTKWVVLELDAALSGDAHKCDVTGRACTADEETCGGWCGGED